MPSCTNHLIFAGKHTWVTVQMHQLRPGVDSLIEPDMVFKVDPGGYADDAHPAPMEDDDRFLFYVVMLGAIV